jgi:hypothetical protein
MSGLSMSFCRTSYCLVVRPRAKALGSKPGVLASAMTSPLCGSIAFARQGALRGPLHAHVDTQDQIRAGDRLAYVELGRVGPLAFDRPPRGVDQHFAVSRGSVQQVLVGAFDPQLADQGGAGIRRGIDVLEILFADRSDIAERVYGHGTEGVVPG